LWEGSVRTLSRLHPCLWRGNTASILV
jgi:hypothetical protein